MGPQTGVDEPAIEPGSLLRRVKRDRVLRDAGSVEVIAHAADRDDERVVGEPALRRDFTPVLVVSGGKLHALGGAIKPDHFSEAVTKMAPMGLGQVVEVMLIDVEAPAAT